jgi:hypothetical protein
MRPEPPPQLEFPSIAPSIRKTVSKEPRTKGYLLNPVRVRQYALDVAKQERYHHFTAVSVEFIQRIDARLRNVSRDEIKRHPSR